MDRRRDAGLASGRAMWFRVTAAASSAALLGLLGLAGTSFAATGSAASAAAPAKVAALAADSSSSCHLGHGVQHVVQLTFDNVHFFRDNPNVPSDLEMMPYLLNFFESNGTFLSNSHTPLIAHTADDILTTNTGLYGDRQGMPVSNGYQAYNADGPNGTFNTTDPASSFAYWTDPVFDTAKTPSPAHDTNPNMVYAPVPPATAAQPVAPDTVTPAPWVPFTRAGCDVGDVSTANQELENNSVDFPKVFGAGSPEVQQLAADPDSFKDAETADYVGVAVHCAQGNAFCATAQGDRGNQTTPSATAAADVLPNEPGGYSGFQALYGHRYIAPQLGAGTDNVTHNGYQVTNSAGNLVDENGNQINGAFLTNHPGFPGFSSINASQSLAYLADMLESGVPVVNGYISDIHGNENIPGVAACKRRPGRSRQRQRLLRRPGAVLQPGLRLLLPAPGQGRHHPVEHGVRAELRRGRPRGRRQRRALHPAHPGQLRRRDRLRQHRHPRRAVHLPGRVLRRAGRQRDRPAGHPEERHHAVQPGSRHRTGVLRDR